MKVYIAGTDRCQIQVTEPAPLIVALYLREAAGLTPPLAYDLPVLDPPITHWPVWAQSAPRGWSPPKQVRTALVEKEQAGREWVRWWNRLLDSEATMSDAFHPPAFRDLRAVPTIQLLLQRHFEEANRWVDAVTDDPRAKREQMTPRPGLFALVRDLEANRNRAPAPFRLRLTVVPVRTKHAWTLGPEHILISRRLISDTDNVLDWLRPRLQALAAGSARSLT